MTEPLLRVEGLTKHFPVTRGVLGRVVGQVQAVDDVSFDLAPGETLGIVGESGCGKTTAGRAILRLIEPTRGTVIFDGHDVTRAGPAELTKLRRNMQIVFQDPYSSLNPRLRVVDIVGEALEVHGIAKASEVEGRVSDLLRRVGLSPGWLNRYPHEFSGGQRQRIGIARAIALDPKLVVCDEAVSALDVSIQAQVVNLLISLRREMGLSYLFIAHDLSVVRHVSHRIAVMYLGQLVELGPSARLFQAPAHPYTRALLSAIPVPDPTRRSRRLVLAGDVPSPLNPPSGCRFHTRCPSVMDRCRSELPRAYQVENGHSVACFHAEGLEGDADWLVRITERIDGRAKENAGTTEAPAGNSVLPALPRAAELKAARREQLKAQSRDAASPASAPTPTGTPSNESGTVGTAPSGGARRSKQSRPGPSPKVVVLAVLLGLAGTWLLRKVRLTREAHEQLRVLTVELEGRKSTTGAYPERLDDLGWRLFPLFPGGNAIDPWGKAFLYRRTETGFELGSTGRDGTPSGDDVGRVPR